MIALTMIRHLGRRMLVPADPLPFLEKRTPLDILVGNKFVEAT